MFWNLKLDELYWEHRYDKNIFKNQVVFFETKSKIGLYATVLDILSQLKKYDAQPFETFNNYKYYYFQDT